VANPMQVFGLPPALAFWHQVMRILLRLWNHPVAQRAGDRPGQQRDHAGSRSAVNKKAAKPKAFSSMLPTNKAVVKTANDRIIGVR
jgi:hypothetical protein